MLTNFLRFSLFLIFCLLEPLGAHAEGSCPLGMYPNNPGSTSGVNGCNPIPGYGNQQQPQPPAPQWERRWGAIATSTQDGVLGVSTSRSSKQEASEIAMQECRSKGGIDCKVDVAYDNQCAAVVVGDGGYNTPNDATIDEAIAAGMKTCRDSGLANCHVYYSSCSLPVQIR